MKNLKNTFYSSIILGCILTISTSCTKETTTPEASNSDLSISLSTTAVSNISQTTATSGGTITIDSGAVVESVGVCWSTSETPTIADNKTKEGLTSKGAKGTEAYESNMTGLTANTTYNVRAYATTSKGTGYGSTVSFKTLAEGESGGSSVFNPNITYGSMTDGEGNTYKTVTIGTQTWMAENLKATKYNDGTAIPNVTDNTAWENLTTGAFCTYNNTTNADTIKTYGKLYNWYAVNTGKLCTTGWHVPSNAEWVILGNNDIFEGALKETGTSHWNSPNTGTNSGGFTALPAGGREHDGTFRNIGNYGTWWVSNENGATEALLRGLGFGYSNGDTYSSLKESGFSVRCIKD
jgi:uncharacterized protein (TIGR02145 family)